MGVGPEWGRAGACHVPGVVVAFLMLIFRVHPNMCSSFTITCPTCGCCNHLPFENTRPAALPLAPSGQAIRHDLTQCSLMPAAGHTQVQIAKHPSWGSFQAPLRCLTSLVPIESPQQQDGRFCLSYILGIHLLLSITIATTMLQTPRVLIGHGSQPPHRPAC